MTALNNTGLHISSRTRTLYRLLALLPVLAFAQPEMPLLTPGEIPGLEILRAQTYAGKALYGYINGGADLYHEYGFERLTVQVLRLGDEAFHTEIFRMSDRGSAFGIFSVSRGECVPDDSLPRTSCVSPYAIQWAQSQYFVRIANETASPVAQALGLQLARNLSRKIGAANWTVPSVLAAVGATEQTVLLVRGILGIQNGFDQWSPFVEGLEGFEAMLFSREDSTGQTVVGEFRFASDKDLKQFSRAFSGREKFNRSFPRTEHRVLVLESDAPLDSLWAILLTHP